MSVHRARLAIALMAAVWACPVEPGAAQPRGATAQATTPVQSAAPAAQSADPDPAYSAFQRGFYLTAFREATKRVDQNSDVKSMTLLGELYADGLGVPNDDKKA